MTIPTDRTPDVGGFSDPRAWMQKQLFDRRMVLLSGVLDDGVANSVGASPVSYTHLDVYKRQV